jgi:hypothetical protein
VKPQRNRTADALRDGSRRADRQHVGDNPLARGRLGDRLERLDLKCKICQRINSSRSLHITVTPASHIGASGSSIV